MELAQPNAQAGDSTARSPARRSPWFRIATAIVLGLVTTIAVAAGLACWVNIGAAPAVVAKDGDHLQPWHILLRVPGAQREVWFEKGRVYGSGKPGPAGASSAAVSCWSYATQVRRDPRTTTRTDLVVEPRIAEVVFSIPPQGWSASIDRRGFPFHAFESRIVGHIGFNAPNVYRVDWGTLIPDRNATLSGAVSLPMLRIIPWRPIPLAAAANTAIYSVAWWVLLGIPGAVLAVRRRRGGLCPRCAYDLRGVSGCPECGWGRAAPAA
jgi:hypothetical protein